MINAPSPDAPALYEIRLRGRLSAGRLHWFEDMAITDDGEGNTLLTGPVADQAALHGLLERVRDLGLVLLAVRRLGPGA